jgi:acyl-CoA thioester hydrolase
MNGHGFQCQFRVGWAHVDFNQHMGNLGYLAMAVDARLLYFESEGVTARDFMTWQVGPVIVRDEVDYLSEIGLMEAVTVTLAADGLSADCARMKLRSEFFRADGRRAAQITSQGLWLDLATRRSVVPPEPVVAALRRLARTAEFAELPPGKRGGTPRSNGERE